MARSGPGEFEQVVLLALAGFEDEATGGDVFDTILTSTDREPVVGAVYLTLARLAEKGWADVRTAAPEAGRGGKPRKFYRLAPAGGEELRRLRSEQERLWRAARHPLVSDMEPGG